MEVGARARQEVLIELLIGWWSPWKLFFHDGNQFLQNLVHLIPREQVGNLKLCRHFLLTAVQLMLKVGFLLV